MVSEHIDTLCLEIGCEGLNSQLSTIEPDLKLGEGTIVIVGISVKLGVTNIDREIDRTDFEYETLARFDALDRLLNELA